jgi:TfoX/Sxy family transcriptional regulator of competence genes
MKWRKSPPELIDLFAAIMPGAPAEQRKMFGYPAAFVNGNLFMGLFQDDLTLRLPESQREKLLAGGKVKAFEPMPGRPMREYVAIPDALARDRKELARWVADSLEYGASLKPKSKAKKPAKTRTKFRSR